MISKEQIRAAKQLWEQARVSAALAHESYALLVKSKQALLQAYRAAGFPFNQAAQEFESMIEEHADRYRLALEHMDAMAEEHQKLLEEFKKMSS